MERIGKMFKILLILIFMAGALLYGIRIASALDEGEAKQLMADLDKLAKDDPKLAEEVEKQLREAVSNGEIEMPERDERGQYRESGPDAEKIEKEFETLLKELIGSGMTSEEAEKKADQAMREKYGEPGGFEGDFEKPDLSTPEGRKEAVDMFSREKDNLLKEGFSKEEVDQIERMLGEGKDPSEIFKDHDGFDMERGRGDFERGGERMSKEEMEKEFAERMGREPTDQEREMMREMGEREMMDREWTREDMDREFEERMGHEPTEQEREMMEREYERDDREQREQWEKEGPPPPPQE